jgi:hypothetical protein
MSEPDAKIGFADAVRQHGDNWLYGGSPHYLAEKLGAATALDMRGRGPDRGDALRMCLAEDCSHDEHLFQVERPTYRCGCDGLCEKHPDCPGAVYQPGFPYKRAATDMEHGNGKV